MRLGRDIPIALVACAAALLCAIRSPSAHPDPQRQARQVGERLERAPASAEQTARLYVRRGMLHAKAQHWTSAINDFDQALHYAPNHHDAQLRKAGALLNLGCNKQSERAADAFLDDHVKHPQALIIKARALDRLGAPERGLTALDAGLPQLDRPSPSIFLERSRMSLRADKTAFNRALAGLDRGMQKVGHVSTLVLEAVALEQRAGRPQQALERIRTLQKRSGGHPRWMLVEGKILEQLNQTRQAGAAYRRALAWIAELPPTRRSTPAMRSLQNTLTKHLDGLDPLSRTQR
jgi:tetratricopeptide (TPR) repeat protein